MKARQLSLRAFLALMVLSFVGCAQQESGTPPKTIHTQSQATQAADFDHPLILKLRGVLRDHEGKRVRSFVGVMFAIYEQQEGGAALWQEIQNIEVDTVGRFTAQVGSTTNEGIPPELFATGKTRWLGKEVLLPGEVEEPRIRLVRTPYGLMAGSAAMLVIPPTPGDQPVVAETQQASDQAANQTTDSPQDESANRPSGSKRRLHRRHLTR